VLNLFYHGYSEGFSVMHMKGSTPPPPGTVPIRMPLNEYNPRPTGPPGDYINPVFRSE
jgi:hypothetical protein